MSSFILGPSRFLRDTARRTHKARFPDRVSVWREQSVSRTRDFGSNTVWQQVNANIPAKFWTVTGGEATVLAQVDVRGEISVSLPWNADVRESDRLVYYVRETGEVFTFEVTYNYERTTPLATKVAAVHWKLHA